MIYFWRVIFIFSALNLINLWLYDGGAGMEPVWIGIIIGSLILSFQKLYHFFFSMMWFKGLVIGGLIFFVIVQLLIVGNGLGTVSKVPSDYLIVLGARVRGETPSLELQNRLNKAYDYLVAFPETLVVLSGGQGLGETITEAEAMRRYLQDKGIDEARMILENTSTNTKENLENSFKLIDDQLEDAKVTVVTSGFHVLRSKMIAKDLGKKVEGIGSPTLLFLVPNYYLREFFAVIAQYIV